MQTKYFKIVPIEQKHIENIARLQKIAFSNKESVEQLSVGLKHLYIDNPFTGKHPTSVVALNNNKVIGFRGLVGLPFCFNHKIFNVLIPSSANTHPDFRRQGLFSLMNHAAFEMLNDNYRLFLNTSSNTLSTPGYLKLGWQVLGEKDYLYKPTLLKKTSRKKGYEVIFHDNIPIDDIIAVSEFSMFKNNAISIVKNDEKLTQWLFNLPNYKFCSLKFEYKTVAYCYYLIKNKTCIIADFDSFKDKHSLPYLTSAIAQKYKVSYFNFFTAKNKSTLYKTILSSGFFSTNNWARNKILNKPLTPILIRPVKKDFSENDFRIDNVDLKNIDNWNIVRLFNY